MKNLNQMEKVRLTADKEVNLSELKNLAFRIAEQAIKLQGYYTFYECETGKKIFVTKSI